MIMGMSYYYGIDGTIADRTIMSLFNLGTKELRYSSKLNSDVYNFVGFVFSGNNALVVFPKHYYESVNIRVLNSTNFEQKADIKLLYDVIQKYNSTFNAQRYIGNKKDCEYEADYPFASFYSVYDYYNKYGLFMKTNTNIVPNGSGKVSWKDTIRKSQKIISAGNIIFVPLYKQKKNNQSVFLTDCMAFIIDYTIENYSSLINLKTTGYQRSKFDYFSNIDYVIQQLRKCQSEMFKDSQKRLVQNMIDFFVQYKSKGYGGTRKIKINNFKMVWQDMIEHYLNKHFIGFDETTNSLMIDESKNSSVIKFNNGVYNDIDSSDHHFSIDVDHIAYDNNELYIFDSKYYTGVYNLNYKQYAYNEILRYRFPNAEHIYNALILPGVSTCSNTHFEIAPEYAGERTIGNKIIEQYFIPKNIMIDYLL